MAQALRQPMTEDDVSIEKVQTATLRRHESQSSSSARISLTPAIRAAGLEDGGSFRFLPEKVAEFGMLPALGSEESADGRSVPLTRNILREGANKGTLRLVIPREALDAIPDLPAFDAIEWDDPPELTVWAGDRVLGFERQQQPESRSVTVDRDADRDGSEDADENQEATDG